MKKQEFYDHKKPRKLMDQVSDVMRLKHYAFRTEQTYVSWIKRFIFFTIKNIPGRWVSLKLRRF
jgi:Phage integrase, N-terminal SAM-like domain